MLSVPFRSVAIAAFAFALLPACSGGTEDGSQTGPGSPAPEFSQADKIAARSLSLSNAGTTQRAESPQEQALQCSAAIEALRLRLRDSGTLSETQLLALGEAKAIYDRRVRGVVAGAQASGQAENAAGSGEEDSQETSPAEQARIAIGCLQDLQANG